MSQSPWNWQPDGLRRIEQAASLIRLDGPDTRRFLHGQTSAAIEGRPAGSWIPTCLTSATGRLRALAEVLLDDTGAWLLISGGDPASLWQALDQVLFPADRVQLGPVVAARVIRPVGEDPAQPLPRSPAGQWLALDNGRGGWLLGDQLVVRAEQEWPSWLADRPALTQQEQERWRIQQGLPAWPSEINDSTNPFELGLAERVSLSKGCYVGQETLAKLSTYDGVKQQLRRWHGTTSPAAPGLAQGTLLFNPEGDSASRTGQITSALAVAGDLWIGLALIRRQALDQDVLRAGQGPNEPILQLSIGPAWVDPPAGANRQG
jgi:folate-binding protein YgfZ